MHAKRLEGCILVGRLVKTILIKLLKQNMFGLLCVHGHNSSTCLKDSDDMMKFESRSKS